MNMCRKQSNFICTVSFTYDVILSFFGGRFQILNLKISPKTEHSKTFVSLVKCFLSGSQYLFKYLFIYFQLMLVIKN